MRNKVQKLKPKVPVNTRKSLRQKISGSMSFFSPIHPRNSKITPT